MSRRKGTPKTDGTARRARELASIARVLDERKRDLAYGEFERWALRTYPRYPIQVLRYLRKSHRVFGKELPRLLERLGQKKVFLLVGLDDPWAPIEQGISLGDSPEPTPVDRLSVSQLRAIIRERTGSNARSRTGWGSIDSTLLRIASLWPRVQKNPPHATLRRDGARRQLERLRDLLRQCLAQLDVVVDGAAYSAVPTRAPEYTSSSRAIGAKSDAPRPAVKPRDPSFLD